jgi:hypothetical protein
MQPADAGGRTRKESACNLRVDDILRSNSLTFRVIELTLDAHQQGADLL